MERTEYGGNDVLLSAIISANCKEHEGKFIFELPFSKLSEARRTLISVMKDGHKGGIITSSVEKKYMGQSENWSILSVEQGSIDGEKLKKRASKLPAQYLSRD